MEAFATHPIEKTLIPSDHDWNIHFPEKRCECTVPDGRFRIWVRPRERAPGLVLRIQHQEQHTGKCCDADAHQPPDCTGRECLGFRHQAAAPERAKRS